MAAEQMDLITIGGKVFALPFSSADSARRKQYFEKKQYEKEPTILGEDRGPNPSEKFEKSFEGGFFEESPRSNSELLDYLLHVQTGGAREHISVRIQAAGDLLKNAKSIFNDSTAKNENFYIPIAEIDISGENIDISEESWNKMGNFIERNIKSKQLSPKQFTTFEKDGTTFISKQFDIQSPALLQDILRQIIINLGIPESEYNSAKKEYTKDENSLTIQYAPTDSLDLLLGRQLKGSETSNTILKSITSTISNTSLDKNGIVKIFVGSNEKYSKPLGEVNIPVTNSSAATGEDEEAGNEETTEIKTLFLKPEEITILQTLGFDYELLRELGSYLPTFFDNLPSCSTDASMLLKHECETSYFVLWSVMFKAQARLQERMKENVSKSKFLPDIESGMARQTTQSLFDLHKKPKTQFNEKDILTLFTIVRKSLFTQEQKDAIIRVFTIARNIDYRPDEIEAILNMLSV